MPRYAGCGGATQTAGMLWLHPVNNGPVQSAVQAVKVEEDLKTKQTLHNKKLKKKIRN